MINIYSIINALSEEEQSNFVTYLKRKNKRIDTKNIQLFRLLKGGENDAKTICNKLYNKDNRNAYHALRNRLVHSLIEFTANKNLEDENSTEMQIIKYILASRTFLIQKKYDVAFKILDKAEQLADEHLLYPILNEIYHTKIQYASEYPKANLDLLIEKQLKNREKHQLEDELNNVYSKLKLALNSINFNQETIDFEEVLNQSLKDSNIKIDETLSFKSLYQILQIANISAFVTTKYYKIEDFALRSYSILRQKKDSNKQLYYQIQIVYIIANTLFRNRKFKAASKFLIEMKQLMQLNNNQYYKTFILKQKLVDALIYNFTNKPQKAISKIETILQNKHTDIASVLDLKLCLIMFYFQQGNISKAKSIIAKLYHTDNWYSKKVGMDWVIKKNLVELLLYAETQDEDLFFSRLKSIRKKFKNHLTKHKRDKTIDFLKFVENYFKNPEASKDSKFKDKIEDTFSTKNIRHEDIFDLSFYAWLKSKSTNTSVYETTLQLIKK